MIHAGFECEDRAGLKADAFILSINSKRNKTEPYSLRCGFGELGMFTGDTKGMLLWFFISQSLLYLLPATLSVGHPSWCCSATSAMQQTL